MTHSERAWLIEEICEHVLEKIKRKCPSHRQKVLRFNEISREKNLDKKLDRHISVNLLNLYS